MATDKVTRLLPAVFLWGGTGQAKVVRPIIDHYGSRVVAVFDDTPNLPSPFDDIPIYRGWDEFLQWIPHQDKSRLCFVVTIGNPHGSVRLTFHDRFIQMGLQPGTVVHPSAYVAHNAVIGSGAQIMAGAIIGAESRIGKECIINTKASIDHENVLEDGVEIAPGATLCGLVRVGVNAWVGAGATVLPRITIGHNAIVGAGAVVTEDVPDGTTVVGIPAKSTPKK
jgi:sugar O-acyltransferase (sialic acid O-acetyltransferase NeuD family)